MPPAAGRGPRAAGAGDRTGSDRPRRRRRVGSLFVVATAVLVVGTAGVGPIVHGGVVGTAAGQSDGTVTHFGVWQDGTCNEVAPLGAGATTVSEFYGYSAEERFSSTATLHLQENQVSNLFVYYGAEGYSLVVLHDQIGSDHGSAVTVEFEGLPADGEWAVEDDDYPGQDDVFDHRGTESTIDWMWEDGRTDGAAFRGIGADEDVEVTIDPGFNEDAAVWDEWNYTGGDNRTVDWRLLGRNDRGISLDMDEEVVVSPGGCPPAPPVANASVPRTVTVGESFRLDARASTAGRRITGYDWSLGDGATVTGRTATYAYEEPGTYTVELTVIDAADERNRTTTTVVAKDLSTPRHGTTTGTTSPADNGMVGFTETVDRDGPGAPTSVTSSSGSGFGVVAAALALLVAVAAAARLASRR